MNSASTTSVSRFALVLFLLTLAASWGRAEDQPKIPPKALPLPGETLRIDGHEAFLILPSAKPNGPLPWIWYAPTLRGLPGKEEKWMFEKFTAAEIAIAGVDAGESYGNAAGSNLFSSLYQELTERRGLSKKPVFLARSRGGLMAYNWAVEHPGSVGGIAGIYPVCNLESYPGLTIAAKAYGLSQEEMKSRLAEFNPLDRLMPLAKAQVPIFHIHGDQDVTVPLEKNSQALQERLEKLGAKMEIIIPKGQGHNMWQGFFQCQPLVDFAIKQAKAGTAAGQ